MKRLTQLISVMLRSMANGLENIKTNDDVDLMADVDDQRAHHFGIPEDFNKLDDSA